MICIWRPTDADTHKITGPELVSHIFGQVGIRVGYFGFVAVYGNIGVWIGGPGIVDRTQPPGLGGVRPPGWPRTIMTDQLTVYVIGPGLNGRSVPITGTGQHAGCRGLPA